MHILQIISYLYPAWGYGGPGKLVYELSRELADQGHTLTVYTTDAFDQHKRRSVSESPFSAKNPSVRIFRTISNSLAFYQKIFLSPVACLDLWRNISRYDVVHIHEIFTPLAAVAAIRCQQLGIPLVVSAHGTLSGFHRKHRGLSKKIFFRFFGTALRNAACFVAATKEEEEEYRSFGIPDERITLVPNGIDTTPFEHLPQHTTFRTKYEIQDTKYVLLYIGRINPLKGLDQFVEALHMLPNDMMFHAVIGGSDDGYMNALKEQVATYGITDKVTFTGMLAGEQKLAALAEADLFVYPSPGEGFSLAILEGGAAGLPLLITEGCKFPDVARAGAGQIVNGSAASLAEALRDMLSDKKKLQRMGQAAQRLVQKDYSIKAMGMALTDVYKNTMSSRAPKGPLRGFPRPA